MALTDALYVAEIGVDVLDGIAIKFVTGVGDPGDGSVEHVGLDVMPSGDVLAAQDVTVSVRDEGRGISSDEAVRLFQKFSRLPGEAGSNVTGHGLGLAICRGIVEAHGGRIWVESDGHERGSTFSFTVPVAVAGRDEQPVDVSQRATHLGRISRPGERTRVLVVDDDPQVLRLVQRVLTEAGYRPIATPDPAEALRLTVATVSAPTVWMSQMLGSGTKLGALQLALHAPSLTLRRGNRIVPSIKAEARRG